MEKYSLEIQFIDDAGELIGSINADVIGGHLPRIGDLVTGPEFPEEVHDRWAASEIMSNPDVGPLVGELRVSEVQHSVMVLGAPKRSLVELGLDPTTVVIRQPSPGLSKLRWLRDNEASCAPWATYGAVADERPPTEE